MKRSRAHAAAAPHLDRATSEALSRAREQDPSPSPSPSPAGSPALTFTPESPSTQTRNRWVEATTKVLRARVQAHSRGNICDALRVGGREHMSAVDSYDGGGARLGLGHEEKEKEGGKEGKGEEGDEDLVTVKPVVDGRMLDVARKKKGTEE